MRSVSLGDRVFSSFLPEGLPHNLSCAVAFVLFSLLIQLLRHAMERDAVLLGVLFYFILIGIVVVVNEAFCKSFCMRNARRHLAMARQSDCESELVVDCPGAVTKQPSRVDGKGDACYREPI